MCCALMILQLMIKSMHINEGESSKEKGVHDVRNIYINHCRSLQKGEIREDFKERIATKLGLGETNIWVKENSCFPWVKAI